MTDRSICESVIDYFAACPLLQDGKLNADFLGGDPVEYVVETIPSDPVVSQYTDGGSVRQFVFVFASREAYGTDVLQNIANSSFYERLQGWIEANSRSRVLPVLQSPLEALRLDILSSGYVADGDTDNARYQLQCRLVYYKPGR